MSRMPYAAKQSLPALGLSLLLVVGCGGSDSPVAPEQEEEARTPLSYAQIAGDWKGTGEDLTEFWMEVSLEESAFKGENVGEIVYGLPDEEEAECGGDLRAQFADHPEYRVTQIINFGSCVEGVVYLTYDPTSDTLDYYFEETDGDLTATGSLERAN